MVTRFGSREICDVTFKALVNGQRVGNKEFKAGQPVFVIDTATASNMEQASTSVYAQGGRGYNRLIAWEGEKTLTFTVTDALMSPLGLAVLTGAGIAMETAPKHIHTTFDVAIGEDGTGKITPAELTAELGLKETDEVQVCNDTGVKPYATVLDGNGAIVDWVETITLSGDAVPGKVDLISVKKSTDPNVPDSNLTVTASGVKNKAIKLDFYVLMNAGATQITIEPDDFGGNFYVEADTLYRSQSGKDMAAVITFPKVKIQSAFTLAMAPTGDPSTFDFTMDAMPGYTYFNRTKKVVCTIDIVDGASNDEEDAEHIDNEDHSPKA